MKGDRAECGSVGELEAAGDVAGGCGERVSVSAQRDDADAAGRLPARASCRRLLTCVRSAAGCSGAGVRWLCVHRAVG